MALRARNVYKRKDGRWEARYIRERDADGRAVYASLYSRTYSGAKQLLEEACRKGLPAAGETEEEQDKMRSIAEAWLVQQRDGVKISTYTQYEGLIRNHIVPYIGDLSVCSLMREDVEALIKKLLESGRRDGKGGLSPKTVASVLLIIKGCLRYARTKGYVVRTVLEDIVIRRKNGEMRVLTCAEQDALVQSIKDSEDPKAMGVFISLYTGLRLGEVCALRWRHIDLLSNTLSVRGTMQRVKRYADTGPKTEVVITRPKTENAIRQIPIPAFLLARLRERRAAPDAFVLTGREEAFVEPRTMENYFKRCVKNSGIRMARVMPPAVRFRGRASRRSSGRILLFWEPIPKERESFPL